MSFSIELKEMPKSCRQCPVCRFEGIYFYCGALNESYTLSFSYDNRKQNCPIKSNQDYPKLKEE